MQVRRFHGPRLTGLLLGAFLAITAVAVIVPSASPDTVLAAPGGQASKYVAISPVRVLDTRELGAKLLGDDALSVNPLTPAVISAAGVDALSVEAVVINLTITQPVAQGWLKAWPTAEPEPPKTSTSASTINNRVSNETIANMAIVPVGANGRISIQALNTTHVVVDVQGVFVRASSSTDGRFVPLPTPRRALDTRTSTGPVPGQSEIVVDVTTVGVPANASAAVINVVAADTRGQGFLTFWPEDGVRPTLTSNLNYPGGGYRIAANAITGLANGKLRIYANATTDVVVDVVGYMTGPGDADSTVGLFVPITPERTYDSRPDQAPVGSPKFDAMTRRAVPVAGRLSVPATGVLAVSTNLTMTETAGPGFLEAYPKEPRPENYSTLNASFANQSIANHAIVALDQSGFNLYAHNSTHAIVDVTGYFLDGTTTPPTAPPRTTTMTVPTPEYNPGLIPAPTPSETYEYLIRRSPGSSFTTPYSRNGQQYWGWNPCKSITYAVNAQRATQVQMDALNKAIKQVEDASGFDLVYKGEATGSMYIGTNGSAVEAPIIQGQQVMAVFGFSDPYETPVLDGSTIGIGGIGGAGSIQGTNGGPGWVAQGGFAIADITDVTSFDRLVSTFSHEIGHMIGLDHVNSLDELMYGFISPRTEFGNGDKTGLYSIGEPQCLGGAPLTAEAGTTEVASIDVDAWVVD